MNRCANGWPWIVTPSSRQPDPVGLHDFARPMHLFQYRHLRPVQGTPFIHPALESAHLPFLVTARMLLAQPAEQAPWLPVPALSPA